MDSVSLPGRVGEGRACWSLGNAYVSMGSPAQALTFAKKHLEISQEVSGPALPSPPTRWPAHSRPARCLRVLQAVPRLFLSFPGCCCVLHRAGHPCSEACWLPVWGSREVGVRGSRGAIVHP